MLCTVPIDANKSISNHNLSDKSELPEQEKSTPGNKGDSRHPCQSKDIFIEFAKIKEYWV